jgi:L-ascorbate metabolism protein UlaG (beta-lactamase superfamily)
MHIRKLSHCCLVIETKGVKILLDPGFYSVEEHRKVKNAGIILITHEHADHFHIESLKELVKHTPEASVVTNDVVGTILAEEGITHRVMRHGDAIDLRGIHIEAYGKHHALLHKSVPPVSNIGFFIENRFFFPGDALTDPGKSIDILALPVAGPWLKISESIDYALEVKPRMAFPVHDGVRIAMQHILPEKILSQNGIGFVKLEEGGTIEIKR